jgi:uncharacterized OB-fold protein
MRPADAGATVPVQELTAPVAFDPGFIAGDPADLTSLRLRGSRCLTCGIALLGQRRRCENCAGSDVADEIFATTGNVWTWTVQRYAPPPPYEVIGEAWQPRAVAWVDLADGGPRILAPVIGPDDVEDVAAGMAVGMSVDLAFTIAWHDVEGRGVVAFAFRSAGRRDA